MHDLGVEFEPVMSGDTGILRTEYRRFVQSVLEVLAPFVERRYKMKTTEVSSVIHKELVSLQVFVPTKQESLESHGARE